MGGCSWICHTYASLVDTDLLQISSVLTFSDWSRYIKIGAYDCASDAQSSNDTCPAEGYPQWRIFCPLTNSTQLAFDSERRSGDTTPEEILMWSIKKINKIAPQCYGKSWPIRPAIEYVETSTKTNRQEIARCSRPQTRDDLTSLIPKNIQKFQLFISDDILQYSLVSIFTFNTASNKAFDSI